MVTFAKVKKPEIFIMQFLTFSKFSGKRHSQKTFIPRFQDIY